MLPTKCVQVCCCKLAGLRWPQCSWSRNKVQLFPNYLFSFSHLANNLTEILELELDFSTSKCMSAVDVCSERLCECGRYV